MQKVDKPVSSHTCMHFNISCQNKFTNSPSQFYNNAPMSANPSYMPSSHSFANNLSNGTATYLIRRELGLSSSDPFTGDPTKFHSWVQKFHNRIDGLNLSATDIISLLESNTKGDPKRIVQDYQVAEFNEPHEH